MIYIIVYISFLSQLLSNIQCKYEIIQEFEQGGAQSGWLDQNTQTFLKIQYDETEEPCIRQAPRDTSINWTRQIDLPLTNKIYLYFEFSLYGNWNSDKLQIYSNNIIVFESFYSLNKQNSQSQKYKLQQIRRFTYNSYILIIINQQLNQLNLQIKAEKNYLGLEIKNVLIMLNTQSGRNQNIEYSLDVIPFCQSGQGFYQYYCSCKPKLLSPTKSCINQCERNQLYDPENEQCYWVRNCYECQGQDDGFICDNGYFLQYNILTKRYFCTLRCFNSEYFNEVTKECTDMKEHLETHENYGYPVNHFYFFKNIPEFLHFFYYPGIEIDLKSLPEQQNEKNVFYKGGKFFIGSGNTFSEQTIQLFTKIESSQHKLRFRATAYFIDFYPSNIEIIINGVSFKNIEINISNINQQVKTKVDFISSLDIIWQKTKLQQQSQNNIIINISQPLIDGQYVGYFYLEDVNIYQYGCQPNCDDCYNQEQELINIICID